MKPEKSGVYKLFGLVMCAALFSYLVMPVFGDIGRTAAGAALAVLAAFTVIMTVRRLGGRLWRARGLVLDRLSGALPLGVILSLYLMCDAVNLCYSPVMDKMLPGTFWSVGGIVLWAGILFYADCVDRLDNLLVTVVLSGLALSGAAIAGVQFSDGRQAVLVMAAALITGCVFFLSAEYRRLFKATVVPALSGVICSGGYFAAVSLQSAVLAGSTVTPGRQMMMESGFSLLREFGSAEMMLGRGAGYDLAVSQFFGVKNFLLADLLNGGVLRFSLSLALWLCIGYFVGMLFLYRKGVPTIYLLVFGVIFVDAFFLSATGFVGNCLFIPFCALLIAENTMLKKGRARFPGEESAYAHERREKRGQRAD